jgi:hypothetical protein
MLELLGELAASADPVVLGQQLAESALFLFRCVLPP